MYIKFDSDTSQEIWLQGLGVVLINLLMYNITLAKAYLECIITDNKEEQEAIRYELTSFNRGWSLNIFILNWTICFTCSFFMKALYYTYVVV